MRVCRLSGARSPPQQRAISDRTSCSRPYCLQARRAPVQMLADAVAQRLVGLVVQVQVDVLEDVVAVDVARTETQRRS